MDDDDKGSEGQCYLSISILIIVARQLYDNNGRSDDFLTFGVVFQTYSQPGHTVTEHSPFDFLIEMANM